MTRTQGVSVIICCYNSANRLAPTLTHLFKQVISSTIDWEIIVVNNNSTDNTEEEAQKLYAQTDQRIPFCIVNEPKAGLSNARNKGFEAANYDYALMVDDDNWLCPNYVETVFNHLQENPHAAMVGGLGIPELEAPAPSWFNAYASCYATGPQSTTGDGPIKTAEELYGAGCALKLSVLQHIRTHGFVNILSDRTGSNLMSGGDTELCYAFRLAGYDLLYDERISFNHFLPKGRVNWKYLRKLFHGFGMTKTLMDIYVGAINNKPIPTDNQRFPYWFNRTWFLLTNVLSHAGVLLKGVFSNEEGNPKLLPALAKVGQLQSTFHLRHQLIDLHQQVHAFKEKVQAAPRSVTRVHKPSVTVLLPVYNAEKYVAEAIDSILNQTFTDFELLIVNDGSTDSSLTIIEAYTDARIRILNLAQNVGLVKALNLGLQEIDTTYIVRTDADDISLPTRLQKQVAFMQQHKQVGVCGSWFDTMNDQGQVKSGSRYKPSDETIRLKHLYQIHLSHGTAILRTSVLKEHAITYSSDFDHAEDYDIFDRIGMVSQLANMQEVLYRVRVHDSNVSKTFSHVQTDNSLGVKRRIFKRLGVTNITDTDIHIYQELQHQNYQVLANQQEAVLQLLNNMFNANATSAMFEQEFFRKHVSATWFHYLNAVKPKQLWRRYQSASFVHTTDLDITQMLKLRLKSLLA